MTPRLAALGADSLPRDLRESWVVDGTLIPTRDHRRAARSKNDRWSCNAQILIRRRDLRIAATTARRFASTTVACLPTAAIAASPSSSRRYFADLGACATARGADIVVGEPGSNTAMARLKNWRSCGTIAVADVTSRTR